MYFKFVTGRLGGMNIVELFDKRYGNKIDNKIEELQTDINTIKENIEKISMTKDKKGFFK